MYKNERLTEAVLARVDLAEEQTLAAIGDGRIEHEPSITDRFLGYVESRFDSAEVAGVRWKAKTLTSIGKESQEVQYGADFFGVLLLTLPGYRVQKGFLAQAKRIEPGHSLGAAKMRELRTQCSLMLDVSPVSYVFLYSQMSGIRVVSANDVLAAGSLKNPLTLTTWSLRQFYKAHFECFIGDSRICGATRYELENMARDVRARSGLIIAGTSIDGSIPPNRFG